MKWFGVGLLALGVCAGYSQAPIVRRPPVVAGAQAPQSNEGQQVPTIRVQTRLVNVALNVEDAKGAPVGGLGRDDFEVLEDGASQRIAVFEKESATPLSIVLAMDVSESVMTNERLEKEAAKHFVRALLRPQDQLDLMEFSDDVRELVPFTNDRKRIESGINRLQIGDDTALYDAVYLASQRLGETSEANGQRRVIVLISDGGDTVKRGSKYGQALEQAQRAGAMVYSLIVVPIVADAGRNTGGEHALIQLSEDTGGKYYYAAEAKDLEAAFAKVSDDLRTQYVLGYYAPQGARDSFRRIGVRMKDAALEGKYKLRYRSGYYGDGR